MSETASKSGLEDGEGLMGNEGSPWLTASKETGSSVVKLQGMHFADNLNEVYSSPEPS